MRIVPTYDDPLRDLWHTRGLGASSAEVILKGKTKFTDAHKLWLYITKRAEKDPMSLAAQNGLDREPEIAALWAKETKLVGEAVCVIDDEFDFLRSQIDFLSWDGEVACDYKWSDNGRTYAKAWEISQHSNLLFEDSGLAYWWYAAQHQLMILGHEKIAYYCHRGNPNPVLLWVRRDNEHIAKYRKKAVEWYTAYVAMDLPPPKRGRVKLVPDKEKADGL